MSALEHLLMAGVIVAGLIAWIAAVFWAARQSSFRHSGQHPQDGTAPGDGIGRTRDEEGDRRAAKRA